MNSWRRSELAGFGDRLRWLESEAARHSYEYARSFSSDVTYGLNPGTVRDIERHVIDSNNVAQGWLAARIPTDEFTVRVVLGSDEVFILPTSIFVARWRDLFLPGRDDAVVLADHADWVFFYCHEEELEFGHRVGRGSRSESTG